MTEDEMVGWHHQLNGHEFAQGRGAWWAAVYGVAQSQTRLKRLSSSKYGSSVRRCPDPAMGSRQQDRKVTSGSGLEPTALGFTADGGVGEGGNMHESSVCDSVEPAKEQEEQRVTREENQENGDYFKQHRAVNCA